MGAVSGLRSMSGPAIVSEVAKQKGVRAAAIPLKVLAAGEMIADKFPFMPDRTDPPSLAFRAAAGAFSAYTIGKKGRWLAALVGATAAVAASYAGLEYRRRSTLPPLLAAVLEDAVAVGIGYLMLSYTTRSHENRRLSSVFAGPGRMYRNR